MKTSRRGLSLHIGLNRVDPAHYDGWSGPLRACEADADDMRRIAAASGFTTSIVCKTPEATRERVIAELDKAADELRPEDLFFITYSGHGGQVRDVNGDEDDFQDETWCLHDGQLIDDELYLRWQRFRPGVRILVLSDSCHSGSVTRKIPDPRLSDRAEAGGMEFGAGAPEPPRYRAMPSEVAWRTYDLHRAFYDGLQAGFTGEQGPVEATVRLISGCRDDQLSGDGAFNGTFTAALLRAWDKGAFQGTYAAFHRAIVGRMPADQTPQHGVIGKPNPTYDAERPFTI